MFGLVLGGVFGVMGALIWVLYRRDRAAPIEIWMGGVGWRWPSAKDAAGCFWVLAGVCAILGLASLL